MLIVDSVMALFRVDFSGRGELADRQQKLAQLLARLVSGYEPTNAKDSISHSSDKITCGVCI